MHIGDVWLESLAMVTLWVCFDLLQKRKEKTTPFGVN